MLSLTNVKSSAHDARLAYNKLSPFGRFAAILTIGLVPGVPLAIGAGYGVPAGQAWIERHTPIQQNSFMDVDGYKATTKTELSEQELVNFAAERNEFANYVRQQPKVAEQYKNYHTKENDPGAIRRASYARMIPDVRNEKSLAQKAYEVNLWVNDLIDYDVAKGRTGTSDPSWFRNALDTADWGKGVCTDQALLKYQALSEAGFPEEKMALLIVGNKEKSDFPPHMVVLLKLPEGDFVMDNSKMQNVTWTEQAALVPLNTFLESSEIIKNKDGTVWIASQTSGSGLRPLMTLNRLGTNVYSDHRMEPGRISAKDSYEGDYSIVSLEAGYVEDKIYSLNHPGKKTDIKGYEKVLGLESKNEVTQNLPDSSNTVHAVSRKTNVVSTKPPKKTF